MRLDNVYYHGWWVGRTSVQHTGGPSRVITNEVEDPKFKPRPVGFTAKLEDEDVPDGPEYPEPQLFPEARQ